MLSGVIHRTSLAPSNSSALSALFAFRWDQDSPGVLIPHLENHIVVRFGPTVPRGIQVHAFGARQKVHRKFIHSGHRTVTARIRLGASDAVLGIQASEIAGQIVPLEELWDDATIRRLYTQLDETPDTASAAVVLEKTLTARLAKKHHGRTNVQLALTAADKLMKSNVNLVALELGVSERHLRRVFQETIGVSPKAYAKVTRFHWALQAARDEVRPHWASIAVDAGYYDQAHLIADFRSIAGATPRTFMRELRTAPQVS